MCFVATDAAAYERSMGRWSRALAEPFLDACALPPGGAVLDAGCGTGALAEAVLARDAAARLTGVDVAAPFLEAARARVPGADFREADIASLPDADGAYDAALSLLVLGFVPDPLAAARELRRVARPGGLVAAAMWDFRGGMPALGLFADTAAAVLPAGEAWRSRVWANPVGLPGNLTRLFRAAGLQGVRERDILIRQTFSGFEDWWGPWRSGQGLVGSFLAGLPPAQRVRLEEAGQRAWLAGGQDGPRSFVAVARLALGRVPDAAA